MLTHFLVEYGRRPERDDEEITRDEAAKTHIEGMKRLRQAGGDTSETFPMWTSAGYVFGSRQPTRLEARTFLELVDDRVRELNGEA